MGAMITRVTAAIRRPSSADHNDGTNGLVVAWDLCPDCIDFFRCRTLPGPRIDTCASAWHVQARNSPPWTSGMRQHGWSAEQWVLAHTLFVEHYSRMQFREWCPALNPRSANARLSLGARGPNRNDLRTHLEPVQIIGPLLHHRAPFLDEFRPVISRPKVVGYRM